MSSKCEVSVCHSRRGKLCGVGKALGVLRALVAEEITHDSAAERAIQTDFRYPQNLPCERVALLAVELPRSWIPDQSTYADHALDSSIVSE
ncbi:MAG TPA: hypothetical protein VNG12_18370 [Acidimicrobiales bacterium]|nr:hypothetical protein [Acidimicrobiales bacterium]